MTNVADRSMGLALRSINKMAGSDTLDRLRLRGPVEKALRRVPGVAAADVNLALERADISLQPQGPSRNPGT